MLWWLQDSGNLNLPIVIFKPCVTSLRTLKRGVRSACMNWCVRHRLPAQTLAPIRSVHYTSSFYRGKVMTFVCLPTLVAIYCNITFPRTRKSHSIITLHEFYSAATTSQQQPYSQNLIKDVAFCGRYRGRKQKEFRTGLDSSTFGFYS
jgi:hypothetical protein